MKKSTLGFALFLTGLLACSVSAQVFIGFDNFNDNTLTLQGANPQAAGQWRSSFPGTGGAFTESGGQMNYTNTSATGTNYGSLTWVNPAYSVSGAPSGNNLGVGGDGLSSGAPFTSSWSAQVALTNTTTPAAGYTLAGMEVYTQPSAGPVDAYYGIYLLSEFGTGNRLMIEWGLWNDGLGDYDRTTAPLMDIGDNTGVFVRTLFDGSSKVMTFFYSTNGSTFLNTGITYDLNGAQAQPTAPQFDGMGINLMGFSNGGAGAIGAGQMSYDNFSVIAIPEPSAYAAFAGLGALGLTLWRRRATRAAATA